MTDASAPRQAIITVDKTTLVPIGLLVSVVTCSIAVAVWLANILLGYQEEEARRRELDSQARAEMALRLQGIEFQVSSVSKLLTDSLSDRWSISSMHEWARLLAAQNPTLNVPAVKQ